MDFKINEDGEIIEYDKEITVITIPHEVDGTVVRSINKELFQFSNIKEIYIPNTVEFLYPEQFKNCEQLEKITFEDNTKITTIPDQCFKYSLKGGTIIIPDSVTLIGESAFSCSSADNVILGKNVKKIEKFAFSLCNLSSVDFLKCTDLEFIGRAAFCDCPNLISLDLSKSKIEVIPDSICDGAKILSKVSLPDSVRHFDSFCFNDCCQLKTIDCNWENVDIISICSFRNSGIESLDLSDFYGTIKSRAFYLSNISNLILSDYITEIGQKAFAHTPVANKMEIDSKFSVFCNCQASAFLSST